MPNALDEAIVLAAVQGRLLDPQRIAQVQELCQSQGSGMAMALREWIPAPQLSQLLGQLAQDTYRCPTRPCPALPFAQLASLERLRCPSCARPLVRTRGERLSSPLPGDAAAPPALDATWGRSRRMGPYLLVEEIGRGSMGVVFLARREDLPRRLALKVVLTPDNDPEALARFQREAAVAARLEHPGIVGVYDVGREGRYRYYAMDFCEGKTLREVLRGGPLAPAEAARVLLELARALAYAHEQGVLHRDLKPANILIDPHSGRPRVTDFGLAHDASRREALTKTGDILGTPLYMSPEQTVGQRETDGRVDVYALGVILYECLTGAPPYLHGDPQQLFRMIREGRPALPSARAPGLPPELERICLEAFRADPAARIPSAALLAERLSAFLERPLGASTPAGERPRLIFAGLGVLSVALALGLAYGLGVRSQPAAEASPAGPLATPSPQIATLELAPPTPRPSPAPSAAPAIPLQDERDLERLARASVFIFHREPSPELKADYQELRRRGQELGARYPQDSRGIFLSAYLEVLARTPRDFEVRRQLLRAAQGAPPLPGEALDVIALLTWVLGFERAAADLCQAQLAREPSAMCSLNLLHILGRAAAPVHDLAGAVAVNEAALSRRLLSHPKLGDGLLVPSWDLHANLGELYLASGRVEEAIRAYQAGARSTESRMRAGLQARAQDLASGASLPSSALRNVTTKVGITDLGQALARIEQLDNASSALSAARAAEDAAAEFQAAGESSKAALILLHGARALSRAQRSVDATLALRKAAAVQLPASEGDLRALICRALAFGLLSAPAGVAPTAANLRGARDLAREACTLSEAQPERFTRGERADAWVLLGRAELGLGDAAAAQAALRRAEACEPYDRRELAALEASLELR